MWPQGDKKRQSLQQRKNENQSHSSAQFLNSQTFREWYSRLETSGGKQTEALSTGFSGKIIKLTQATERKFHHLCKAEEPWVTQEAPRAAGDGSCPSENWR